MSRETKVYCGAGTPQDLKKQPLSSLPLTLTQGASAPARRYRVLAVATHPVQYHVPLFQRMDGRDDLDLHVAYCTMKGAEAAHDPEFNTSVQWDIPLLEGYTWTHEANVGNGRRSFWGLRNPGVGKLIREGHFDAVLCYVSYTRATFWIAYRAARATKTAFLFGTDTTTLTPLDGRKWKRRVKKHLWPRLFRLADEVIVPSSGTRDLMRALHIPEDHITLTPFVVDNDRWLAQSARVDRTAVRASFGASNQDAVVLFCAKLQPWKRPLDLLKAFANARIGKSVLVFAGDGPMRDELEEEAEELGIRDNVRFLGFINQTHLPAIYAAADVMVLPSVYDAFGVVVNEAMLCGCPVIASDHVGAARDLIEQGKNGFVFPCGDTAALSSALRQMLADRGRLVEMGRAARARMETWSPRENIEATMEAVARATARRKRFLGKTSRRAAVEMSGSGATQKFTK